MPQPPACPPCPVCGHSYASSHAHINGFVLDCERCGRFVLTEECFEDLEDGLHGVPNGRALLSHAIRQMQNQGPVLLTKARLHDILTTTRLPSPRIQLENLILLLAEEAPTGGSEITPNPGCISITGAVDAKGLAFVVKEAIRADLVATMITGNGSEGVVEHLSGDVDFVPISLTLNGWNLHEELLRGRLDSRIAFMAMKFGDEQLNHIINEYFGPAVAATGFDLMDLQSNQKAGLIDDRIRVEIRRSKFVLADLTHHNQGAYWEAGFAEGLGKPVIYLCRRDVLDDKENTTHFDTNHHLTIAWDAATIAEDMERLKATIRATLPSEARQED